ncbi:MAG TPA: hypothetical protein VMZ28_10110 [Kofleriaceae bacterium]|nr:hypothetical protein [Kofleriaceae bacterium]
MNLSRRQRVVAPVLALLFASLVATTAARAEGEREIGTGYKAIVAEANSIAKRIENSLKVSDVKVASQLYRLEMASADLILRNSQVAFKDPVQQIHQSARLRAIHGDILRLQERVLEHTLDELDRTLPGEPHREAWAREGIDLYRALLRAGTPDPNAPARERSDIIDEMNEDFVEGGGTPDQINWLGPKYLKKATSGELIEWVQIGERIRLTSAGAKHPIIADSARSDASENGTSVRGAGSLKIYKDAAGEVLMVVVSNSSGNYKPGIGSVFGMVQKLEELGIPRDKLIETTVLPGEPVLFKLLLKSKKVPKEKINDRVARLKATVRARRLTEPTKEQVEADVLRGLRPAAQTRSPAHRARPASPNRVVRREKRTQAREARALARRAMVKARR